MHGRLLTGVGRDETGPSVGPTPPAAAAFRLRAHCRVETAQLGIRRGRCHAHRAKLRTLLRRRSRAVVHS